MTVSQRWSLFDRAATVHAPTCQSVQPGQPIDLDLDLDRTSDAVIAYGLTARRIYDDLKRVIGQAAGLLILAQASARRDAFDLPSLAHAEGVCREAADRVASLSAPGRLAEHRGRLETAARLISATLARLHDVPLQAGEIDLATASRQLTSAYRLLQSTSDFRFGMTMVDFKQGCCTCSAAQ